MRQGPARLTANLLWSFITSQHFRTPLVEALLPNIHQAALMLGSELLKKHI